MTPVEERKDEKIRVGMVLVSDGKSRPSPARLALSMEAVRVQIPRPKPATPPVRTTPDIRERMVQVRRQERGGLGLSIKGGAEHKLPILISKIYKDQAADHTRQLFVGDAIIKVNGEYITACSHDDAVSILCDAGDIVVLTVKHYRAAAPFLAKYADGPPYSPTDSIHEVATLRNCIADTSNVDIVASSTTTTATNHQPNGWQMDAKHRRSVNEVSDEDDTISPSSQMAAAARAVPSTAIANNNGWQEPNLDTSRPNSAIGLAFPRSRPTSIASDLRISIRPDLPDVLPDKPDLNNDKDWVDQTIVPLMMGYVTRYVMGTDKLRPNAFEVRGARGETTGVIHLEEPAALSMWLKGIADNVVGLTNLQMKLFNRHLAAGERIEYMGWVVEGVVSAHLHEYRPTFLLLKGTDVMLFDRPPMNLTELAKCPEILKVYQTMFRVVKESETVDWRQHCFLVQSGTGRGPVSTGPRYFSTETKQELLRVEAAWTGSIVNSVIRLGKKTFTVLYAGKPASLTLDWSSGFSLSEGSTGATPLWAYRFSQLRGSSDDGKSKLKLHFQDPETKAIDTKELECQILQSLLFCMHAFLTAKVASVDPAFLASIRQTH